MAIFMLHLRLEMFTKKSVLTKNVNESLMDYVKYQIFKATQELFLKYKVV